MSKEWSEFDKFADADDLYLPIRGEGETMASQITTAVCKLVYKWYNDGDVFDNTNGLDGWCNDLSSYANWLWKYCPEAKAVLDKWWFVRIVPMDDGYYEDMLYELCEKVQNVDLLHNKYEIPKKGSVYKCEGPFELVEYEEEEEDDIYD